MLERLKLRTAALTRRKEQRRAPRRATSLDVERQRVRDHLSRTEQGLAAQRAALDLRRETEAKK